MTPNALRRADLSILACPTCRERLHFQGTLGGRRLERGSLVCDGCNARWPVRGGVCQLFEQQSVQGKDALLGGLYDVLAPAHDPAVKYTLPLFGAGTEEELRAAYIARLELEKVRGVRNRPVRILEVGVGTGADVAAIRAKLHARTDSEIWGVELSEGMLELCRQRLTREKDGQTRLLRADAHALPFRDGVFDRVLQVGAVNGFRDPARAIAEMSRVVIPGGAVVIVDEQLDPAQPHGFLQRAFFRLITFYEPYPHAPRELLPAGARNVVEEQINRFFFCLRFSPSP
jgi:ubiquinone/menaquinone biosynthesis C-methylase UbiE/uncharacterized protein YbaR (Trm112 family)